MKQQKVSHASACMQVLHSSALLAVVQTMAYGAITPSPSTADPRYRLVMKPNSGKQRAYLLAHVSKRWLSTYADCNSSDDTPCTETATVAVMTSISVLEHAIDAGYVVTQKTLSSAVDAGNLSVIQHLVQHYNAHVDRVHCDAAARSGNLHVLQWLHAQVMYMEKSFGHAADAGHLVLQCLHAQALDMGKCFEHAADAGHLHILQWAHEHGYALGREISEYYAANTRIFAAAAGHGDLHLCQWLQGVGCDWDSSTCTMAAHHGHLAVLKWAREKGCYWNRDVCTAAAGNGHLEVLRWAVDNGCTRHASTCEIAAHNGHLEVLQWAAENGFVFNPQACLAWLTLKIHQRFPDPNKLIPILEYLHAQGCQLTTDEMSYAARCGSIDVLHWLRDHGCAWNTDVTRISAVYGHLHVLKWLREQGCPWSARVMSCAVKNRDIEMMQWLHDAGCPREHDARIGYGAQDTANLYVCKWVFDHGYPWYRPTTDRVRELCYEAERLADPDMLEWLMAREGIPQDKTKHWKVLIDTLRREKRANARRHK